MIDAMHDDVSNTAPGYKWNDYRKEDYIFSRLSIHSRRVARSLEIADEWLSSVKNPYVALSGGKDSVCVLAIVQRVAIKKFGKPIPAMWHDSGVEWPGVPIVIDALRSMGLVDELVVVKPESDVIELKKLQLAGKISAAQKDEAALFRPVSDAIKIHGFDSSAVGLRKEESNGRKMDGIVHGTIYKDKTGHVRCCPIYDWKWQDVFAFIAAENLPLHPIYSAPLFQLENRGRIRLSWWLSTDNWRHGEVKWVRQNYPEVYAEILKHLPEAAQYG